MNILLMGQGTLFRGGQAHMLAFEFAKKGHKTYLLTSSQVGYDVGGLPAHENLNIIALPAGNYDFGQIKEMIPKIDVCYGIDQSVAPFVEQFTQQTGVKSYCIFLDFPVHVIDGTDTLIYDFEYAKRFYYWVNCTLSLAGTIFVNTAAAEEFKKRYNTDPILVDFAISSDDYLPKLVEDKPSKDFVCGCNRIVGWKGTDYTLQALRTTDYPFTQIYGSAEEKALTNVKAIAREIPNEVTFYEKASEDAKMRMMYNSKVFVYPQVCRWVGGLVTIEAASVKTPSVVFDYQTLRDIYEDTVLYAKKGNISDLRSKIKQLWEDDDLNKELAEKSYELFRRRYTRERMVEQLLEKTT